MMIEKIDRRSQLGLLARAPKGRVAALLEQIQTDWDFEWLRKPEIGSVMVRGRAGAVGMPFNLGELTVTRCSLRLTTGEVGHGYVQGRDKQSAQSAALADALLQTSVACKVNQIVVEPLLLAERKRQTERASKAAATKVEFFTMVRGEDK